MIKNHGVQFSCPIVVACLFWAGTAWAQTNFCTNSTSGYWEQPFWSAGVLPGAGQTIVFTNAWQALAIGAETAAAFAETMQVDAVTLAAPSNSFNELLLNYAGYDVPLVIGSSAMYPFLGSLVVKTNSAMVILSSVLQVNDSLLANNTERGAFSIGGTFNQGDFAKVTADWLHVGNIGPGVYNLTNGLVSVTNEFIGGNFSGVFNQFGGYNESALELDGDGQYDLYGGDFGGSVTFRQGKFPQANGTFKQLDGTFVGDLTFINGNYLLQGGNFASSAIQLPAQYFGPQSLVNGDFLQTGGTNVCQSITAWGDSPREATAHYGSYTLTNGLLFVSGAVELYGNGNFVQTGGFQTNSSVGLTAQGGYSIPAKASCSLSGGVMMTSGLYVGGGDYGQSGGTNLVSGNLSFRGAIVPITFPPANYPVGSFSLSGGLLACSNANIVTDGAGNFSQTGGALQVSNLMAVAGRDAGYTLSGGQLITRDINLNEGGAFHHIGGTVFHSGRITFAAGRWFANSNETALGPLVLSVGASNTVSSLSFPSAASVIRFGNSSSMTWSSQAILTIEGWNGSPAGGGHHQIFFGNNSAALSTQQLSQIQFHNPAGISGTSAATILTTGEIVPARFLRSQRISGGLVLSWPPGATLQTATNVTGPYFDVANTSPYTNYFSEARGFFRLRN